MCEAVMQKPVICCVFRARAAIRMPHLRSGASIGRREGLGGGRREVVEAPHAPAHLA